MSTRQQYAAKQNNTKQAYGQKKPAPPLQVQKFDEALFKITDVSGDGEKCKFQIMGWPKYNGNPFTFQTPWFKISQYGVSQLCEFVKNEEQRMTLKLPLDDQPGCLELIEFFNILDDYLVRNKTSIFPAEILEDENPEDISTTYVHKSINRAPQKMTEKKRRDLEKKAKEKGRTLIPKCNFWKAKLDVNFETKKIDTPVYVHDVSWVPSYEGEQAPKPTRHIPKDADDLTSMMPFASEVRMLIQVNKFYADKSPKDETKPMNYGLGLKIKMIESKPRTKMVSQQESYAEYAFVDEGQEEQEPETKTEETKTVETKTVETKIEETKTETQTGETQTEQNDDPDSDSGDSGSEDTSSEESVEEPVKEPVKTPVKEPVKKVVPTKGGAKKAGTK